MLRTRSDRRYLDYKNNKDPKQENRALRRRLDSFVSEARTNEQKLRRFQRFELSLIEINHLVDLIEAILHPNRSILDWDVVSLMLLDPSYEIRHILDDTVTATQPNLIFASDRLDLDNLYPSSLFPMLGSYRARHHASLFPQCTVRLQSVALLPLVRRGRLIGSLNIGSVTDRYEQSGSTDFLEHLAAIVAICLENATNAERIKRQGLTDPLTSVNNRRYFDQRLHEETELARRNVEPLSCLLFDVDHFKQVNDRYGHQTGDLVLKEFAALVRAQLRGSDTLARYGGEEFSALLANTPLSTALEVAERIRHAVAEKEFCDENGQRFNVTVSIGVTTFVPDQDYTASAIEPHTIIGIADEALYNAKAKGRNQVVDGNIIDLNKTKTAA